MSCLTPFSLSLPTYIHHILIPHFLWTNNGDSMLMYSDGLTPPLLSSTKMEEHLYLFLPLPLPPHFWSLLPTQILYSIV